MKIKSIKEIENSEDVYNLHVEDNHNYFAENICVSNCHDLKAAEVKKVSEALTNTDVRLGFTGSMPDNYCDQMLIQSVLGPVIDKVEHAELQEKKQIAGIDIRIIKYQYDDTTVADFKELNDYQQEKQFVMDCDYRNKMICKVSSQYVDRKMNALILVNRIDHCNALYDILKANGVKTYKVMGETKVEERNRVRHEVEHEEGCVIVATTGVFSTGISIKRIHTVIFASPGKSKIQTLQSIGRGLRLHHTKKDLHLYDMCENLRFSEQHLKARIKYYEKCKFEYTIKEVEIA